MAAGRGASSLTPPRSQEDDDEDEYKYELVSQEKVGAHSPARAPEGSPRVPCPARTRSVASLSRSTSKRAWCALRCWPLARHTKRAQNNQAAIIDKIDEARAFSRRRVQAETHAGRAQRARNAQDTGYTPLIQAAFDGNHTFAEYLMIRGADLEIRSRNEVRTGRARVGTAAGLLKFARPRAPCSRSLQGATALCMAARRLKPKVALASSWALR